MNSMGYSTLQVLVFDPVPRARFPFKVQFYGIIVETLCHWRTVFPLRRAQISLAACPSSKGLRRSSRRHACVRPAHLAHFALVRASVRARPSRFARSSSCAQFARVRHGQTARTSRHVSNFQPMRSSHFLPGPQRSSEA